VRGQIVNAFPDGWMTSGQISREGAAPVRKCENASLIRAAVSLLKKKLEKETMEAEADG
jgi:hypothetical protein